MKLIPRVDAINRYLDESIRELHAELERITDSGKADWQELDELFLDVVGRGEISN